MASKEKKDGQSLTTRRATLKEKTKTLYVHTSEKFQETQGYLSRFEAWKALIRAIRKRRIWTCSALAVLLLNTIGFMAGGESFLDALYSAILLFFFNPVSQVHNAAVVIGRFLAIGVSSTAIFSMFSSVYNLFNHSLGHKEEDSTAVYSDNAWGEDLAERLNHGYLSKGASFGLVTGTRYHIFMYSDDLTNLNLYHHCRAQLEKNGSYAYIMLNHTDAFLLSKDSKVPEGAHGPRYFNLYDLTARMYWQQHHLYDRVRTQVDTCSGTPIRIAVIGYGPVGQAIVKYAILNNIYRLGQAIQYHLWGCPAYQADFLKQLPMLNNDCIIPHDGDCLDSLELLSGMDRVILTQEDSLAILQQLLYTTTCAQIHYYSDRDIQLDSLFDHKPGQVVCFGQMDLVLTEENIKQERLYRQAKLLNYDYALRRAGAHPEALPADHEEDMEQQWRDLSGFLKGSNIAQADHLWIKLKLREDHLAGDKEIGMLEHLRWCRFHFYNHWTYDPELRDQEKKKDTDRKKHGLLTMDIPPEELPKDLVYNDFIREELRKLQADMAGCPTPAPAE